MVSPFSEIYKKAVHEISCKRDARNFRGSSKINTRAAFTLSQKPYVYGKWSALRQKCDFSLRERSLVLRRSRSLRHPERSRAKRGAAEGSLSSVFVLPRLRDSSAALGMTAE